LASERLVPAVPRKSLHPLHAPSTPVAVCPVTRPLTDLSQKGFTLLVLTTLASLRRVFEGFTFVRLSDAHLHEIDLALFSNAAESARGVSPRAAHRSGRDTLASSGSCPRTKTAAFRREMRALPVVSWPALNVGDLPPLLHGHYPASLLLQSSPPLPAASVLSASQVRCLCLFPWHRWTGSQVPYESPNESHASYTPDTAWPVGRSPPHSSWSSGATPVLMPSKAFRCVTRGSLTLISLIHT
jgi:hypothetical protein